MSYLMSNTVIMFDRIAFDNSDNSPFSPARSLSRMGRSAPNTASRRARPHPSGRSTPLNTSTTEASTAHSQLKRHPNTLRSRLLKPDIFMRESEFHRAPSQPEHESPVKMSSDQHDIRVWKRRFQHEIQVNHLLLPHPSSPATPFPTPSAPDPGERLSKKI